MKVMIHAHTTFSADGELTPSSLGHLARKRGFDAVLVSDDSNVIGACRQIGRRIEQLPIVDPNRIRIRGHPPAAFELQPHAKGPASGLEPRSCEEREIEANRAGPSRAMLTVEVQPLRP